MARRRNRQEVSDREAIIKEVISSLGIDEPLSPSRPLGDKELVSEIISRQLQDDPASVVREDVPAPRTSNVPAPTRDPFATPEGGFLVEKFLPIEKMARTQEADKREPRGMSLSEREESAKRIQALADKLKGVDPEPLKDEGISAADLIMSALFPPAAPAFLAPESTAKALGFLAENFPVVGGAFDEGEARRGLQRAFSGSGEAVLDPVLPTVFPTMGRELGRVTGTQEAISRGVGDVTRQIQNRLAQDQAAAPVADPTTPTEQPTTEPTAAPREIPQTPTSVFGEAGVGQRAPTPQDFTDAELSQAVRDEMPGALEEFMRRFSQSGEEFAVDAPDFTQPDQVDQPGQPTLSVEDQLDQLGLLGLGGADDDPLDEAIRRALQPKPEPSFLQNLLRGIGVAASEFRRPGTGFAMAQQFQRAQEPNAEALLKLRQERDAAAQRAQGSRTDAMLRLLGLQQSERGAEQDRAIRAALGLGDLDVRRQGLQQTGELRRGDQEIRLLEVIGKLSGGNDDPATIADLKSLVSMANPRAAQEFQLIADQMQAGLISPSDAAAALEALKRSHDAVGTSVFQSALGSGAFSGSRRSLIESELRRRIPDTSGP